MKCRFVIVSACLTLLAGCSSLEPRSEKPRAFDGPGPQEDGAVLLPNQWYLRPAGKQVLLGDFPVNIAVHPQGRFAAVLHCGYGPHEIKVVDVSRGQVISSVPVEEAFYGLVFSADGRQLFCSGASEEVVRGFSFDEGYLSRPITLALRDVKQKGIPAGLAVSRDGEWLYAANVWGQTVSALNLKSEPPTPAWELPLGAGTSPHSESPFPVRSNEDEASITKRADALLVSVDPKDPFPYGCVLDEARRRLYVSLWAQASVAVIDLETQKVVARWAAEEHPNEMILDRSGQFLYVANANRNTVTVLNTATGRTVETLNAAFRADDPPGATPNGLALSPDQRRLFVANANVNAVAVFDVSQPGKSRSLGFIPAGWYPTSVRVTPDGKRLLVANGKGVISKPNRLGPQPGRNPPAAVREYIAGLMEGTLSIINLAGTNEAFEKQMKAFTATTYRCRPGVESEIRLEPGISHPIPRRLGEKSPIKYCLYVIKENRTYDQILGDMPEGNGDPALCLFPERVTPNHHKLARDFVLLDNFYVESEVSADGHEWTMGAYATDFVEKSWPLSYGHNERGKYSYPSEGNFLIAAPAGGYLWDRAHEAGVTYRSYGEFINNGKTVQDPGTSRVKPLQDHFDPWFRGFDMDYPDVKRAERFIAELKRFEGEGDMPRLQILRLPSDHTAGTADGKRTPTAHVADNDVALGMVVEALTHSKFWPELAIFVVEDDAQNGPDHVDAHRTIAYAISPYVKRGTVDSTLYSTTSMLRTMELILGLKPMTQFDAAARPMVHSFQARPDLRPYRAVPARVDLEERNTRAAWGGRLSDAMDFSMEDAADDLLLNEVVWRSVRGAQSPMPAPTRAAFVFPRREKEDDD
jgi:DNA-binding beta-propeller fold protein YncE